MPNNRTISFIISVLLTHQSIAGSGSSILVDPKHERLVNIAPAQRDISLNNGDGEPITYPLLGVAIATAVVNSLYKIFQEPEEPSIPSVQNFQDVALKSPGKMDINSDSKDVADRQVGMFSYTNENFSQEAWKREKALPNSYSPSDFQNKPDVDRNFVQETAISKLHREKNLLDSDDNKNEAPKKSLKKQKTQKIDLSHGKKIQVQSTKSQSSKRSKKKLIPKSELHQNSSLRPEYIKNKTIKKQNVNLEPIDSNCIDYTKQIVLWKESVISLPESPFEENIPIIEALIKKVIQEKIDIPVKVYLPIRYEKMSDFSKAFIELVSKYPPPFTWERTTKGLSNLKDGTPYCIAELTLKSLAKKMEEVEKKFVYQCPPDEKTNINWLDIYDVAMRSGFTLKDFDFNNSIKIRTIELTGNDEQEDLRVFQQFLEQKLTKDINPFHIVKITLNKKAKGRHGEMYNVFLKKIYDVGLDCPNLAKSINLEEGIIYLCLENIHRKRLDLHGGRTVKQAEAETREFIMQSYETFKKDTTIVTGRGNHVNANGKAGIIRDAFVSWVKKDEELSTIIKEYFPVEGEGGYRVKFVEIRNININDINHQDTLPFVKGVISKMAEKNNKRLCITIADKEESNTCNKEFKLMSSIYGYLCRNDEKLAKLISPISFESKPGEMKIIFNHKHSKSMGGFTFGNSYGSTSIIGTIE